MLKWIFKITDKQLDLYLISTGALAGAWEWIAEHADGFMLFLAGSVVPITLRIWRFTAEMQMARDKHKAEMDRLEQEKRQDQERHLKQMEDE